MNVFDTLGRRVSSTDPDLGVWIYAYDDAGRLITQTDAKAQVTSFTYDALDRVLTKISALGLATEETTTNTYDEARTSYYNMGQLTSAANTNATIKTDFNEGGYPPGG